MPTNCLASFNACTAPKISKALAWVWRRSSASSTNTEARSGRRRNWTRAPSFISPSEHPRELHNHTRQSNRRTFMNSREVDILLVEDNKDDLELALHALRRERLANRIQIARDG